MKFLTKPKVTMDHYKLLNANLDNLIILEIIHHYGNSDKYLYQYILCTLSSR